MSIAQGARERVITTIGESVVDNPVMAKELRTRMRGYKAFITMGGYTLLLSGALFIAYISVWVMYGSAAGGGWIANQRIGQQLFATLTWTQVALLTLIAPSLTSGLISQEISRKTMEMLALTRLTAGKIVVGNHLAGLLYMLMLLVCSLPLAGVSFMFGGISPAEVVVTYALLASYAFLLCAVGVFWSSFFSRTAAASGISQITAIGIFLATLSVGGAGLISMMYRSGTNDPFSLALLNPGWAPYGALLTGPVSGIRIPIALAAFVLHSMSGLLLLLVASTHVRYQRVNRALSIRALFLITTLLFIWLGLGGFLETVAGRSPALADLAVFGSMVMVAACLMAAGFATGEPTGQRRYLSIRSAFRNNLSGGFVFTLLWALAAYAAMGFCFVAATNNPTGAGFWLAYLKIGLVTLTVVAGVSAVGVLASSIAKSRGVAAATVILCTVLLFLGYVLVLNCYQPGFSNPHSPVWNLAVLWPMTPVTYLAEGWSRAWPKTSLPLGASWLFVSCIYTVACLIALNLAPRAAEKFGGVREE
ncbi:MAG: ABC transporter permease [Armatimonadetes bacterium]|nr:ABC transporter permease [Armatimonadota bacterium]